MVVGGVITRRYLLVYIPPSWIWIGPNQLVLLYVKHRQYINNRRWPDELTQRHLSLFQVNKVWCQAKLNEFAYYKAELIANQQFMDLTVLIR